MRQGMTFPAKVESGHLVPFRDVRLVLQQSEGQELEVTIKPKRRRTLSQNALYWAVVVPQVAEGIRQAGTNATHTEVHEFLKGRFLEPKMLLAKDETFMLPSSTSTLTKEQFSIYLDQVAEFCREYLGFDLELPA